MKIVTSQQNKHFINICNKVLPPFGEGILQQPLLRCFFCQTFLSRLLLELEIYLGFIRKSAEILFRHHIMARAESFTILASRVAIGSMRKKTKFQLSCKVFYIISSLIKSSNTKNCRCCINIVLPVWILYRKRGEAEGDGPPWYLSGSPAGFPSLHSGRIQLLGRSRLDGGHIYLVNQEPADGLEGSTHCLSTGTHQDNLP